MRKRFHLFRWPGRYYFTGTYVGWDLNDWGVGIKFSRTSGYFDVQLLPLYLEVLW